MGGEGLSTLTQDLGDPHPNPLPEGEEKEEGRRNGLENFAGFKKNVSNWK